MDAAGLNAAVEGYLARAPRPLDPHAEADALIVPGYTPRFGWRRTDLHPYIAEICRLVAEDLAAGVAPIVVASGGAVHGPANEAVLIREELLALGVPAERIAVEPCARHTYSNLRNAGRFLLEHGLGEALVVAGDALHPRLSAPVPGLGTQAYYIGYPRLFSLALRCRLRLGYSVGALRRVRPAYVRFRPSPACLGASARPCAEGDP